MSIGELIHRRRKQLGITQEKLSKLTGLPQSQISRLESDLSANKAIRNLEALLRALKLDHKGLRKLFEAPPQK